ncbi:probable membrane protein [Heterostelium album PN500]|uniref:Probable membrane protein n=1 Tax=Heterostelium pallidum (strain ATCC 26659 / Pp 5 / PN500) TaxID=670386 RepID=D3B7R7_HETP5|nr:probable membrane protein [Heterostelium album PN500]EFA82810.1 probable membrane protein [Heterostelium album PN500]|eukprot:XP_020434927.1 probable membrane protein [Heterostelium album PN500]
MKSPTGKNSGGKRALFIEKVSGIQEMTFGENFKNILPTFNTEDWWSTLIGLVFRAYHVVVNLIKRKGYQSIQESPMDEWMTSTDSGSSTSLAPPKKVESIWTEDCTPEWLKCVLVDEYFIKLDRDYAIVSAGAVSICGSSAANAIGSTIGASKSAISFPIAIMALWTIPCITLMPVMFTKWLEDTMKWSSRQGGAWIGGTIDTTGAVVASAAIIDEEAKQSAAIVKMLQNCLIGPICLIVLITNLLVNKDKESDLSFKKVLKILFDRFPKFVLGFFIVCAILTTLPTSDWKSHVISTSLLASAWFETMGFVCIGLNIRITEIYNNLGVMKLILFYLLAQCLDMFTTGLLATYAFS